MQIGSTIIGNGWSKYCAVHGQSSSWSVGETVKQRQTDDWCQTVFAVYGTLTELSFPPNPVLPSSQFPAATPFPAARVAEGMLVHSSHMPTFSPSGPLLATRQDHLQLGICVRMLHNQVLVSLYKHTPEHVHVRTVENDEKSECVAPRDVPNAEEGNKTQMRKLSQYYHHNNASATTTHQTP